MEVVSVIAGVVAAFATVPAKPLEDATLTLVTVPEPPVPGGVPQVPSPRQKVVALAEVPEFKFVVGRLPVTSEAKLTTLEATFTKSEPFHATSAFVPEVTVTPVVGPEPRITTEPVPALMTT